MLFRSCYLSDQMTGIICIPLSAIVGLSLTLRCGPYLLLVSGNCGLGSRLAIVKFTYTLPYIINKPMITTSLIATAALLSCQQAQYLVQRVMPETMTRTEYYDIIGTIIESAPGSCPFIIDIDQNYQTMPTL